MDILIKGMDMPKDDEVLSLTVYPNGSVCLFMKEVSKAIEVSDCGCLVNKDDVLACIEKRKDFAEKVNDEICVDLCNMLIEDINASPTIVEASNGTDS